MKALEFIIDKNGNFVFPTTISEAFTTGVVTPPVANQITCIYYNTVTVSGDTATPSDPVTTGLTGTIKLQARMTSDSSWSDIKKGTLDLSLGQNMVFPYGVIQSINAICTNVQGCHYVLVRLDRGV